MSTKNHKSAAADESGSQNKIQAANQTDKQSGWDLAELDKLGYEPGAETDVDEHSLPAERKCLPAEKSCTHEVQMGAACVPALCKCSGFVGLNGKN